MILAVNRGSIKVALQGKIVHVPGEMFLPASNKMEFAVDLRNRKHWDFPDHELELTQKDVDEILHDIQTNSKKEAALWRSNNWGVSLTT